MIQWPIFNAGKTEATISAKTEEKQQAYYAYQKAVLAAVQDAEDALIRTVTDQQRIQVLTAAQTNARILGRYRTVTISRGAGDLCKCADGAKRAVEC